MTNGQAYFYIHYAGNVIFNIFESKIPVSVVLWVNSCVSIFSSDAFRFLRFDYEDYVVEVRNTQFGRYPLKLLWKAKSQ